MTNQEWYVKVHSMENVRILKTDGSVVTGLIERIEQSYLLVDELSAFGDMVVVNYDDIDSINEC